MSYITLTYYPPETNGFGAGTEKTLKDWGCKSAVLEKQNSAQDNLGVDVPTAASGPDLFAFGGKVEMRIGRSGVAAAGFDSPSSFGGGAVLFVGYRMKNVRTASGRVQEFRYKFSGPWGFFMERHVFQKQWPSWNGTALVNVATTSVVLGQSAVPLPGPPGSNIAQTSQMTIAEQVVEIVQYTANQTATEFGSAQFALDADFVDGPMSGSGAVGGWEGYCPMDAANDITCAEALVKTVKLVPSVSVWFDYDKSPPVLHVATWDTLPSTTLNWGNGDRTQPYGNYTSSIDRRDDLVPSCVDYKYRITSSVTANGVASTFYQVVDDVACPAGSGHGVQGGGGGTALPTNLQQYTKYINAECATFDFEGQTTSYVTVTTFPVPFRPKSDGSGNDLATWKQTLVSSFSDKSIKNVVPLTDATLTYPDGTPAPLAYTYCMVGGTVPPSVIDPNNIQLKQGVQLTLSAKFQYDKVPVLSDGTASGQATTVAEVKSVSVNGLSVPSGNYGGGQTGEIIPYGLAAYIYNIERNPQYDGKHGISESDPQTGTPTVTDACKIGTNLCLTGGLAEYATMDAQVQRVSYDLMTGHTDIAFGVASHLGGTEFIERLRVNRGPRWFYLIAANSVGTVGGGGAQSGPTQLKDTQGAASTQNVKWMPHGDTADGSGTDPSFSPTAPGFVGAPGTTHDTRVTGQPNYGAVPGGAIALAGLTAPTLPTLFIAEGIQV